MSAPIAARHHHAAHMHHIETPNCNPVVCFSFVPLRHIAAVLHSVRSVPWARSPVVFTQPHFSAGWLRFRRRLFQNKVASIHKCVCVCVATSKTHKSISLLVLLMSPRYYFPGWYSGGASRAYRYGVGKGSESPVFDDSVMSYLFSQVSFGWQPPFI